MWSVWCYDDDWRTVRATRRLFETEEAARDYARSIARGRKPWVRKEASAL